MNDPKIHIQPRFNNQMSIRLLFLKNYTFRKSTSEFCFLFFFFSKSRTQTNCYTCTCTPFCSLLSVQQTWPLRKHDGQAEVSVCAIIGGFRSSVFVSFFAFNLRSVYASRYFDYKSQWTTQPWTVGKGKKIRLNTKDKNQQQVDFVHKPNQHLIIKSRSNLTIGLFILWMDYRIN